MVDKSVLEQEMVDKWSIKPSLAEKLVDKIIMAGMLWFSLHAYINPPKAPLYKVVPTFSCIHVAYIEPTCSLHISYTQTT